MGSLGPSSHSINYGTPQALIESEFSKGQWVDVLSSEHLNPFSRDEARAPYDTLKKYCEEVQGGTFSQKEEGNPFYGQNPENIKQKTGLFECISSKDIWYARINTRIHKGPTRVAGAQGFYISASYVEPHVVAKEWGNEKLGETKEIQARETVRRSYGFDNQSSQQIADAESKAEQLCELHQRIGGENSHKFPMEVGDGNRRFLDRAKYNSQRDVCEVTLRYETSVDFWAKVIMAADERYNMDLARKFIGSTNGHKFIEQMMTNHYEPEFSSMDRPEMDVVLEVSFRNNEIETKRFQMFSD